MALLVVRGQGDSPDGTKGLRLASAADSPGAAALLDPDTARTTWSDVRSVDRIRPLPWTAPDDEPAFYRDGSGCQVNGSDPTPKICPSGDQKAPRSVMLVGDSKIAQWQPAFADMGRRERWKVLSTTKSNCPFADVTVTADHRPREDCRAWGRTTLAQVIAVRPDLVVTSQRSSEALLPDGSDRSRGAMVRGLQSYWSQLQQAGIPVVVLLDNPVPSTHPVYQCVEDHLEDLSRCAFSTADGVAASGAPVLREAARGMPGVEVMDLTSTICPDDGRCPAVIGNVLLYREGSHLTASFVKSAETQLGSALYRATDGLFGTAGQNG